MPATLRFGLPTLISGLCIFVMSIGSVSAAPAVFGHHATAKMDAVTINITSTSGTVWGSVTASYTNKHARTTRTCSAASCSLHIPQGVTARLSQTAVNSSTWPFQSWTISSKGHTSTKTGASVKLKVTGKTTVTAVYVLAQSSSPYNGDGSGNGGGYGYTP